MHWLEGKGNVLNGRKGNVLARRKAIYWLEGKATSGVSKQGECNAVLVVLKVNICVNRKGNVRTRGRETE